MKPWTVLAKEEKRVDKDSVELHLRVQRGGEERDAIVSGATFYSCKVGETVDLPFHSGTSEQQVHMLGDTLRRVLVRAVVVHEDSRTTGPELFAIAEEYIKSKEPPPPTLVDQVVDLASQEERTWRAHVVITVDTRTSEIIRVGVYSCSAMQLTMGSQYECNLDGPSCGADSYEAAERYLVKSLRVLSAYQWMYMKLPRSTLERAGE